jgi:hypothetical protein
MTPHKHAAIIKQWADGATIQRLHGSNWWTTKAPEWNGDDEYRVKPKEKTYRVALMGPR